jgi:hypothetical protein
MRRRSVSNPKRFVELRWAFEFTMELEQELQGGREVCEYLRGLFRVVLWRSEEKGGDGERGWAHITNLGYQVLQVTGEVVIIAVEC